MRLVYSSGTMWKQSMTLDSFFGCVDRDFPINLFHDLAILEWDRGWGNNIEYWQPSYVPLKQQRDTTVYQHSQQNTRMRRGVNCN